MSILNYIDDKILRNLVKDVLDAGINKKKQAEKDFNKNVIDPFSTLFDSAVSGFNHDTWKQSETVRQCQKTLTNHIGNLHQKLLGQVMGWEDLGTGGVVDLVCKEKKIIAEIKNKYNTVTGGKLADQYYSLERLVMPKASQYKDYTSYFVNIIPSKPERFDNLFTPSDKDKGDKCPENPRIRVIDGASFYALVTGRDNALSEFYAVLPSIIEDIFQNDYKKANFSIPDKDLFKIYFETAYNK